mmetsp:Transcript_53068/g.103840  ORF Transcript_53068/g.103840 Transcript_53068/m.103840 type:complete len:225 (-) Transcript_53068:258-932(-)
MFGKYPLLVTTIVFGLAAAAFIFILVTSEPGKRTSKAVATSVVVIAFVSYVLMWRGYGIEMVGERPFYYARYFDWALTTPLLILDLGLVSGTPLREMLYPIGFDVLMIAAGYLAGYQEEGARWYLFALGCFFMLPVAHALMTTFQDFAEESTRKSVDADVKEQSKLLCTMLLVLWSLYPVVWVASEGLMVMSVYWEVISYAWLDFISKAVFGFIVLSGSSADTL